MSECIRRICEKMKPKVIYLILTLLSVQAQAQFSAREYFKFGKNKFDDGKYFEAIDFLDKAIQLDPAYENALFVRAESFMALQKYQLAVDDYTKVIDNRQTQDSYSAQYFLNRAIAKMETKDYRGSYQDFSTAFRLVPIYADGHYEYSRFKYLTLKDKNEAIKEINKAIEINPQDARYYARRAQYRAHVAKFDYDGENILTSAVADLDLAIQMEPDNVEFRRLRSEYNKELGEPDEAIEDYDVMIEINPNRVEAYTERGLIEMQNDQYTEAINDFTKSIELQPNKEYNYRYRGLCRHNIQDFGGAYKDYTTSIQLLHEALKSTEDTIKIKKILADTYVKRGAAATSLGNTYNSCEDFRMAYELGSKIGLNYLRKYCGI